MPISGGSGGYYPLTQNSAALGAGDSAHCLTKDQRNDATYARDSASCNIGAINEIYVPPAPPAQASGQAGEWSPTAAPSQPRATPTLPPNFRISGSGRATTNYTVLDGQRYRHRLAGCETTSPRSTFGAGWARAWRSASPAAAR